MKYGHWSSEALAALPVEANHRLRGLNTSRLDTFVDAAFAFAVTLLVISAEEIPRSFDEFIVAVLGVPSFMASFAQLSLFWWAHRKWSRRYGLDDAPTLLLSLTLVGVVLIYVYPLRFVFDSLFDFITGGLLPADFRPQLDQLGMIFTIYSVGFIVLSLLIAALHQHALNLRGALALSEVETSIARLERDAWLIITTIGGAAFLVAVFAPAMWKPFSGMVYGTMGIIMPIWGHRANRRFKARFPDLTD